MTRKKVCWNITAKCNQNCKYCHRFLNVNDLDYENNERILKNLIHEGIKEITWTGGEALLYPNVVPLMKLAKENGIKNKLITNGLLLAQSNHKEEICDNLDYLVLSIDSIDNQTNLELGRGINHYKNIKEVLDYVKDKDLKLNINTVVSKENINQLDDLGNFLNNYKINTWKFFKFMPLRETAEKNKNLFEITDAEFDAKKGVFKKFDNISNISYKKEKELEESILIVANGDIIKTENGKDIKKGNALYQNLMELMDKGDGKMEKIRTVVAHNDEEIRNAIINSISNLEYIEVVGTASDGIDAYNKIVELKPEIVFSKYNYNDMKGLELIKKTKEKLQDNFPSFNTIGEIPDSELMEAIHITGNKLNACVIQPYDGTAKDIVKAYKEYKYQ